MKKLTLALLPLTLLLSGCIDEEDRYTPSPKGKEEYLDLAAGTVKWVTLADLIPTQSVIGHDQINYKLGRYNKEREKLFEDICESYGASDDVASFDEHSSPLDKDSFRCEDEFAKDENDLKTVVVGPDSGLYLTDGHHTFSALTDHLGGPKKAASMPVLVKVSHNYAWHAPGEKQSLKTFWLTMIKNKQTWLYDQHDASIQPYQLPSELGKATIKDDPYRSLIYFSRKVGWEKPDEPIPFIEFYWAREIRQHITLENRDLNEIDAYRTLIGDIANHIVNLPDTLDIGHSGKTAQEMGKLDSVSKKKLNELICKSKSKSKSKKKLGKLAYALQYRGIILPSGVCD